MKKKILVLMLSAFCVFYLRPVFGIIIAAHVKFQNPGKFCARLHAPLNKLPRVPYSNSSPGELQPPAKRRWEPPASFTAFSAAALVPLDFHLCDHRLRSPPPVLLSV